MDLGWSLDKDESGIKQWINPEQTLALSINYFNLAPDIPTIKDLDALRSYYREQIVKHNGGIIQVDLIELNQIKIVKTIFKIPQDPDGMTYLASLTIPFAKCSYVIKVQAPELGLTGMRDSFIANKLVQAGEVKVINGEYENWFSDPYEPGFKEGTRMNKAERAEYDFKFPKHPLTLSRQLINQLESQIELAPALSTIKRFKK